MGDISSTAVVFSYPGPAIAGYSLKRQYFVYQFGFALGSGIGGLVISAPPLTIWVGPGLSWFWWRSCLQFGC